MDYTDLQSIRRYNFKAIVALILDKLNEVKNNPRFSVLAYESPRNCKNTLDSFFVCGDDGLLISILYKIDGDYYLVSISDSKNTFSFQQTDSNFWKVNNFPHDIDSIGGIFIGSYDILVKFSDFREG